MSSSMGDRRPMVGQARISQVRRNSSQSRVCGPLVAVEEQRKPQWGPQGGGGDGDHVVQHDGARGLVLPDARAGYVDADGWFGALSADVVVVGLDGSLDMNELGSVGCAAVVDIDIPVEQRVVHHAAGANDVALLSWGEIEAELEDLVVAEAVELGARVDRHFEAGGTILHIDGLEQVALEPSFIELGEDADRKST